MQKLGAPQAPPPKFLNSAKLPRKTGSEGKSTVSRPSADANAATPHIFVRASRAHHGLYAEEMTQEQTSPMYPRHKHSAIWKGRMTAISSASAIGWRRTQTSAVRVRPCCQLPFFFFLYPIINHLPFLLEDVISLICKTLMPIFLELADNVIRSKMLLLTYSLHTDNYTSLCQLAILFGIQSA